MFVHDLIKINYIRLGYLPNLPYHLVSDKEMFEAFTSDEGYFINTYECPKEELNEAYETLREFINSTIAKYQAGEIESLPSWIYGYMLGNVIGPYSDVADINDIITMSDLPDDSGLPQFDADVAQKCYDVSVDWLSKYLDSEDRRPPTMFGETHVMKSLRLSSSSF